MISDKDEQGNDAPAVDVEAGAGEMPAAQPADVVKIRQGPSKRCNLTFNDVTYSVKLKDGTTKTILNKVSGAVAAGEVLAIMGPSGSGKTSLLDVLAHRTRGKGATLTGSVELNGKVMSARTRRKFTSYVAQEDALMGVFTVRETLWFAARFYFGYGVDRKAVKDKVESLIDSVGLRSAADTVVGNIFQKGLSGGQLRRLSMAVELISSPAILLLDEPTSGLDSSSAYAIICELRNLAEAGHTIVCTIHQPSSEIWTKFDRFMLLAKGNVCYMGEANAAVPYFASIGYPCPPQFNPADFIINLVTTDFDAQLFQRPVSIQELTDAYEKSEVKMQALSRISRMASPQNVKAPNASGTEGSNVPGSQLAFADEEEHLRFYMKPFVSGTGQAGFFSNLFTLTQRNLMNLIRNPGILLVRLVMYNLLALFLGLTFLYVGRLYTSQTVVAVNSLLFFVAAFWVFMSVAVIPFVEMERAVFLREKRNGAYTAAPYVLSHFINLLPGTFALAVTTSLFIVFMSSINGYGYFLLILWMCLIFAETFVYFIASISPHYIVGIAIAAGFFGLCMTVEGFFIVFTEIGWWIRWLGYITPHRYGFRAFMRNQYSTIDQPFIDPSGQVAFENGQAVLSFYGYNDPNLLIYSIGGDVGVLFAFACAYLLMFYLVCEFYWS